MTGDERASRQAVPTGRQGRTVRARMRAVMPSASQLQELRAWRAEHEAYHEGLDGAEGHDARHIRQEALWSAALRAAIVVPSILVGIVATVTLILALE